MGRMVAFALAFVCFCGPVIAQQKTAVVVLLEGDDAVGRRVAYSLREVVKRSTSYRLAEHIDALFEIKLVSVGGQGSDRRLPSTIAVVHLATNLQRLQKGNPQTFLPIYLSHSVLTLGEDQAESGAKSILAMFDSAVQEYVRAGGRVR